MADLYTILSLVLVEIHFSLASFMADGHSQVETLNVN